MPLMTIATGLAALVAFTTLAAFTTLVAFTTLPMFLTSQNRYDSPSLNYIYYYILCRLVDL